jgi:hypothetical protein
MTGAGVLEPNPGIPAGQSCVLLVSGRAGLGQRGRSSHCQRGLGGQDVRDMLARVIGAIEL